MQQWKTILMLLAVLLAINQSAHAGAGAKQGQPQPRPIPLGSAGANSEVVFTQNGTMCSEEIGTLGALGAGPKWHSIHPR